MNALWPYKLAASAGDYYFEDLQRICEISKSTREKEKIETERDEFESVEESSNFTELLRRYISLFSNPFINLEIM